MRLYVWRSSWDGIWHVSRDPKPATPYAQHRQRAVGRFWTHRQAFADAWARTHSEEDPEEYTPTTEDVRLVFGSDSKGMLLDDRVAAFDRYLDGHDAEVREQALAPIRAALDGHPVCDVHPDGGIPSCGWKRAVADVQRALDA